MRELIERHGIFIEIYVSTPLEVCEARNRKGLYAKARKGIIPELAIPYEVPKNSELDNDTSKMIPLEASQEVILYLFQKEFLDSP